MQIIDQAGWITAAQKGGSDLSKKQQGAFQGEILPPLKRRDEPSMRTQMSPGKSAVVRKSFRLFSYTQTLTPVSLGSLPAGDFRLSILGRRPME